MRDACGSEVFFWLVVGFVAVNGLLIALAADNFLLYDERYHVGIIEAYSRQWSPIIEDGSANVGLGDTERLPSYLFHYLLSFPYRIAQELQLGFTATLFALRALNVAMVALSFVWLRRILVLLGLSRAGAHVALALFGVVQIVVFVSATVNYDNLLLLLGSAFLWRATKIFVSRQLVVGDYFALATLACLSAITKYTFLLIVAVAGVLLIAHEFRAVRRDGFAARWRQRVRLAGGRKRACATIALAAVAVLLFAERIVRNLVNFGTPSPDCAELHPESFCRTYAVWNRNDTLAAAQMNPPKASLSGAVDYLLDHWLIGLVRSATWVGGETPVGTKQVEGWDTALNLVSVGAAVAFILAIVGIIALRRNPAVVFITSVVGVYAFLTFAANYSYFRTFGHALAVQARYFILVLPFVSAMAVAGWSHILRRARDPLPWKVASLGVATLLAVQGGAGMLTYALLTDESWFGPNSLTAPVIDVVRGLFEPLVVGT